MNDLIAAAVFLVGTHLGIASTQLRTALVQRLGEGAYRVVYSLLSLVALGWLIVAWRAAPDLPLWEATGWRHFAVALMPLPLLLAVCALTQRNPTAVGSSLDPDAPAPATGILRVTRHPLMWGIGLWAILHLAANGDAASLVLFGALAVLALAGAVAIDQRRIRAAPPGWGVFMQATSNVPLLAVLQRRQKLVPREIGLGRVAATIGLYVALVYLHPWLFGVGVMP